MRSLFLSLLLAAVGLLSLAPATAEASKAPAAYLTDFDAAIGFTPGGEPDLPRGPVEDPADWIAVVGIACYTVIPIVLLVGAGFIAYEVWMRNSDASLLSARIAWPGRGARPPAGLVLLQF